jgi:hypothetical protein
MLQGGEGALERSSDSAREQQAIERARGVRDEGKAALDADVEATSGLHALHPATLARSA